MNQMIEKLAKAMAVRDSGPEGSVLFSIHWAEFGTGYIDNTIALLTALREPSEEMVSDGLAATERAYREDIPKAFTAMIDSILPKGGEG